MSSPVRLLGAFVDTLVLNAYPTNTNYAVERREMSHEFKAELEALKKQAQDEEEDIPTRFCFEGSPLLMKTKGSEGFNWILSNSKISLCVNRSSKMLLWAQVRCSSEYLWARRDLGRVITEVHLFLVSIFGDFIMLQPSGVDLAADVVGLDLGSVHDVKQHFISRAQLTDQHPADATELMLDGPDSIKQRWGRLTGLPFGARNAPVSALIYDKHHEIKYKRREKSWFFDLWNSVKDEETGEPLWDGESAVWRIEVRFKRQALNEMKQEGVFHGIDNAYDLEERLPGLWSYAVGHYGGGEDGLPDGWLRYVLPSDDTNRSRWPVHPDWVEIQKAFQSVAYEATELEEKEALLREVDEYLDAHPMPTSKTPKKRKTRVAPLPEPAIIDLTPYIRERKRQVNMYQMVAQIAGCTTTLEAWRARPLDDVQPDLSDTFHFLFNAVEEYLAEKQKDYSKNVRKKRVLYDICESIA